MTVQLARCMCTHTHMHNKLMIVAIRVGTHKAYGWPSSDQSSSASAQVSQILHVEKKNIMKKKNFLTAMFEIARKKVQSHP